jgi:tetratricopeptide (TPR) repeat protein
LSDAAPATAVPPSGKEDLPAMPPAQRFLARLARATEHERAGRFEEAERVLRQLLAEEGDRPAALNMMGVTVYRQGRPEEAVGWIERAIAVAPAMAECYSNLCEIYRALGRHDEALASGLKAAALEPKNARCHQNLAVLHYHRLELDASIASAEQAIALDPENAGAHFSIAQACLLRGEYERGLREYAWRFRVANVTPPMPPTDRPQWDGKPLEKGKRLLLVADQGFGDMIQFARYIPWAAARCPEIALACRKEVQPLFAHQPGIQMLFDRWDEKPDFAAFATLSDLPGLAGTRLETVPADIPYLQANPAKAAGWAERLDALVVTGHRRIGIVWAGRPTHGNDRNRSASLAAFAPLAALPGVTLLSLQKGPAQEQIGAYFGRAPLVNLGAAFRDYADTMGVLENLDLVVTVDTSLAHLAGAMDKRVWIALAYAPDWRWLLERDGSPWYPTARLFRQTPTRDWTPVMKSIADEAAALLLGVKDNGRAKKIAQKKIAKSKQG